MSGSVYPTPTLNWGLLLQDPTTSMQVATKEYVDAKVGGIPEAPTDGQTYGRDGQTATWNAITLTPVASSTAPLMDGTAAAGVATAWSRGDHVHPTDTSRYAASNPSSYVNAAGAAAAAPVQSVATRTGAITLTHTDITDWATSLAPYAPLASPTFTGTPSLPTGTTAVTQTAGTNNTTVATTAFVQGAVAVPSSATPLMDGTAAVGTSLLYARQDHVHPTDTSRAPLGSPALTGTPTAPTATVGTNTTQIATTAFVQAAIPSVAPASTAPLMDGLAAVGTSLLYARQDHVHPSDTSRAPLASPALTGAPTSTTPATADNSTAIATTAFVKAQGYGVPPSPATVAPLMNGTAAVGTSLLYARQDHVHPTDTSLAPLGSPALTGAPTAPTAIAGTNTTQLATTAFVQAALPAASTTTPLMNGTASAGSATAWSRGDHVHPTDTSRAPLASPALTGTPTAPTPVSTDNSTTVATTAYVQSVAGSYLPLAGGTVTGSLTVNNSAAVGFPTPTASGQGGLNAYVLGLDGASYILFNGYLGSGPWNYYQAGGAAQISQNAGTLQFMATATAGTAGAAITTFANTMALGPTGNMVLYGTLTATGGTLSGNLTVSAGGISVTGASTFANAVTVQAGGVSVTGASTMSGGTTFTGGLNCGSTVAPAVNNFTNQIALYGTSYGLTVTGNNLNYVTSSQATNHSWYGGTTLQMQLIGVSAVLGFVGFTPGSSTTPVQMWPAGNNNNLLLGGPGNGNGVVATTATAGMPMMVTCAGTPTGAPVNGTKAASFVYNTTSHSLNIYDPVAAGWYHLALTAGAG